MCEWCCNIPVNNPPKNKRSYFGLRRYAFCFLISTLSFVCLFISFVTPYWIQSWPRIHTSLRRAGLWEFCLDGFVDRLDPLMISYFDCWWILSPYVGKPFNTLVPFWFTIIQVLVTIAVLVLLAIHILMLVHLLKGIQRIERRALVLKIIAIGHVLLLFPSIVIFGANWDNPLWVQDESLHWPSWSYGMAILSCILSFFCCFMFIFVIGENDRRTDEALMTFPMNIPANQVARTRYNLATSQTALGQTSEAKTLQPESIPLISQNYPGGEGSILSAALSDEKYYRSQKQDRDPVYDDEDDGPSFVGSNRSYPKNQNGDYGGQYPRYNQTDEGSNLSNQNPYPSQRGNRGGYYDDRNRRLYLEKPENQYGSEMSA